MSKVLILLFGILFHFEILAQKSTSYLHLDSLEKSEKIMIGENGKSLGYFIDSTSRLTFEQIKNKKFAFAGTIGTSMEVVAGEVTWLKYQIAPYNGSEKWFWHFGKIQIDTFEIYEPQAKNANNSNEIYQTILLSSKHAFKQNSSVLGGLSKPLRTSKTDTLTYYIRLKSQINRSQSHSIVTPLAVLSYLRDRNVVRGVMLGIILAMICYNFFLYFSIKDKAYIWYVGYLISIWLMMNNLYAFDSLYLFPDMPFWNLISLYVSLPPACFFVVSFAKQFLQTQLHTPQKHLFLTILQVLILAFIISFVYAPFFTNYLIIFQVFLVLPTSFLVLLTATQILIKKIVIAKYFLLGFLPLGIMIGFHIIYQQIYGNMFMIVFRETPLFSFMELGTVIESIVMSLALAFRFNLLKKERGKIQIEKEKIILEKGKELTNTIIQTQEQERKRRLFRRLQ